MERSTTFTGHVQVYHNRARAAFGLRGWLRPREHKRATMRLSENACGLEDVLSSFNYFVCTSV